MSYFLTLEEIASRDFLFNVWSEAIGIVVTVLLVTPLVSLVVTWRQWKRERSERLQMVGHLNTTFDAVSAVMEKYTNPEAEEYIGAHLMQLHREISIFTSGNDLQGALGQLSETPNAFFEHFVRDLRQRIDFMDSLIQLFSPHFRTKDAYVAKEYIDSLHDPVRQLNEIRQRMDWVRGSMSALVKLTADWPKHEKEEDEGAKLRADTLKQMKDDVGNAVLEIGSVYKSMNEVFAKSALLKSKLVQSLAE